MGTRQRKIPLTSGEAQSYGDWKKLKSTRIAQNLAGFRTFGPTKDSIICEIEFGWGPKGSEKVLTSVQFDLDNAAFLSVMCPRIPPMSRVCARLRASKKKVAIRIIPEFMRD